jgi:hypothetical protein
MMADNKEQRVCVKFYFLLGTVRNLTAALSVSFTASILWRKVQAVAVAAHALWATLDDLLQLFLNESGSVFSTVCVKTVTRFNLDASSLTETYWYGLVD